MKKGFVYLVGAGPGRQRNNIDWPLIAKFNGTIVFYMGIGNLDYIAARLMENGMNADTPVAIITNATFPTQAVVKASLADISQQCKQTGINPPTIVAIGAAAGSDTQLNWFMQQPLFGRNIVVTRDIPGNIDFADKIIRRGGSPKKFPTIKIKTLTQKNEFLHTLAKITEHDWIIFTSGNGVAVFFEVLQSLGKDARIFGSTKIAAIGGKTADKLAEFGIKADFVPGVLPAKNLAGN